MLNLSTQHKYGRNFMQVHGILLPIFHHQRFNKFGFRIIDVCRYTKFGGRRQKFTQIPKKLVISVWGLHKYLRVTCFLYLAFQPLYFGFPFGFFNRKVAMKGKFLTVETACYEGKQNG